MSRSQQVYADYQGTCISPNAHTLDKLSSFFTIRSRTRENVFRNSNRASDRYHIAARLGITAKPTVNQLAHDESLIIRYSLLQSSGVAA